MIGTLPAYLCRRVGMQILALLAVLTAMMQLLELLDVTTDIFERGQGVGGLLYYAILRLPAELGLALPVAVLLGTMTSLNAMARTFEISAMRACGVSFTRMLAYLLPVLLVFTVLQVALVQVVLPRAEIALKQWWNASTPPEEVKKSLWAHTRGGLVSIDSISPDGLQLKGIRVYASEAGLLTSRLCAARAQWDGRAWQLEDVTELRVEPSGVRRIHDNALVWQTNLHPEEVLRLGVARPYLSTIMLADVIVGSRVGSQPLSYYQTALYRSFAAPLVVFIMLLLALPTAATLTRGGGGGSAMLIALSLGLGFLLFDGIVASLGASGQLPPLVTALAAPLLFISIGLWRLRVCDRP
jgi:lipopolysaccharide export system permease protein